jgi:oligoribonuclease NrnB/cAMP/cGMP phosphodiesterase (DHH superfamily)
MFAAWKKFGNNAFYIPVIYSEPFPNNLYLDSDTEIYILDFSYPLKIIKEVKEQVSKVVMIDHHDSAIKKYIKEITNLAKEEGLDSKCYELDSLNYMCKKHTFKHLHRAFNLDVPLLSITHSGALLSWLYFHKCNALDIPQIIQYVSDADLYKFRLPNSRNISAALKASNRKKDMLFWDTLLDENNLNKLVTSGKAIIEYQNTVINEFTSMTNNYVIIKYGKYKCIIYNFTTMQNEIAEEFYTDPKFNIDFTLGYSIRGDGFIDLNFRSSKDKKCNVGEIANMFNGGGNENTAGGNLSREEGKIFLSNLFDNNILSKDLISN